MMNIEALNYDIRSLLNDYNELQSVAKTLSTLLSPKYKDLVHLKYPNADVEKVVWNETRPYKAKYKVLLDCVNEGLAALRNGEKLPTLNELITLIEDNQ